MFSKHGQDINLYVGDSSDNLFPKDYLNYPDGYTLLDHEPYAKLAAQTGIEKLFFLRQVHGTAGAALGEQDMLSFKAFSCEGDYLITNVPGVGIGIVTADCLPLILHDPVTQSIAAIHAGWRGAVAGIAQIALSRMVQEYGAQPSQVHAYLGPCILPCCYQVGDNVIRALENFPHAAYVLSVRQGKTFFDLPGFVAAQLETAGLPKKSIFLEYSQCTHCTPEFWSYRRQGEAAGRQMTVVSLNG